MNNGNVMYQAPENEVEDEPTAMTLEEYMEYKEVCQNVIDQATVAAKLTSLPEFNEVIMENYFSREPQRLGSMMATGRLNPKQFDECAYDLRSIGHLRTFLSELVQRGNVARDELANAEIAYNEAVENGVV